MISTFIHPLSDVQTSQIGDGTRVWQYAVILPGAKIGRDCNVCAHTFIENNVVLGDNVTVKCGVHLWDGLRIGNGVFIGPNATFCNDLHPRSGVRDARCKLLKTVIADGVSIGAGAVILPGVTIGRNAMVGAGAVVVNDVPDGATVVGNPANVLEARNSEG